MLWSEYTRHTFSFTHQRGEGWRDGMIQIKKELESGGIQKRCERKRDRLGYYTVMGGTAQLFYRIGKRCHLISRRWGSEQCRGHQRTRLWTFRWSHSSDSCGWASAAASADHADSHHSGSGFYPTPTHTQVTRTTGNVNTLLQSLTHRLLLLRLLLLPPPLNTHLFEEIAGQGEYVEEGRVSERRRNLPVFGQWVAGVCLYMQTQI